MKKYLLDTDICIYVIRKKPIKIFDRFKALTIGQLAISSITYAELQFGVQNSSDPEANSLKLHKFLGPVDVLDFTSDAGVAYGSIRSSLKKSGQLIGGNDLLIAAHSISSGYVLVTNNVREYKRVPDLEYENWT